MENKEYPQNFARFYDLIYHQIRDTTDHQYFLNEIKLRKGKVLEIGVGTGRFFIEALSDGADIYGCDISPNMLDILKSKLDEKEHHRISLQGIQDFHFNEPFDLIIAPFRVMMHISEKEEQLKALNNVYKHLKPGSKFIFDAFVPDLKQLISGLDKVKDFEQEYAPGRKMRRIVSTIPSLIQQTLSVHFHIEWEEDNGWKHEHWDTALRFFFRYELEHLIERSMFEKYEIFGDYNGNPLGEDSKEFVVVCWKY